MTNADISEINLVIPLCKGWIGVEGVGSQIVQAM